MDSLIYEHSRGKNNYYLWPVTTTEINYTVIDRLQMEI
jgi:hypothetical protein